MSTFNFLDGRELYVRVDKKKTNLREIRYVYSFEADYSSFASQVNSELPALGYQVIPIESMSNFHKIRYVLLETKHNNEITVQIHKDVKAIKYSQRENDLLNCDKYAYNSEEGWISVEIIQRTKHNRFIVIIKYFFNKLRGSK